ncbi:MAG: hypothetical protein VW981_04720, partial [Rhodobiaceae bacterium]
AMWSFLKRPAAQPVEAIGNVLDALFTSDEERLDKQAMLARIAQQPALQLDVLTTILYALLGLGGLRTFEKIQGRMK